MARSKTKTELMLIVDKIPEDKQYIGIKLVDELVFMESTLKDLKKQIKELGTVEHFKQGKQEFLRECPALKSYNSSIQRYSQLYKQLTDLLPKNLDGESENKNPLLKELGL